MRKKVIYKLATVGMAALIALTPINASAATLIRKGSEGSQVRTIQTTLQSLGYYTYPKITGYYGSVTYDAVKRFQKKNGLYPDGIVGSKTQRVIFGKLLNASSTDTATNNGALVTTSPDKMGALDWFKQVQYIWPRGAVATVTDVDTGKSFKMERTFGTNHADTEPLTKEDSNIIKSIWNGFNWERRAVVVRVGNCILAGSMTGMPHAGVDSAPAEVVVNGRSDSYGTGVNLDAIKGNGVSGVLDIHFLNSRTHTTNVIQKSQQDMVKKAATYIAKTYGQKNI
ncbi:MAG TPA: peptidoglycan-binding domain-containing protein [Mobilitalea sp.]|nr:peptidoglycan-binding domain-containing protein [Mobilitalea sp.]